MTTGLSGEPIVTVKHEGAAGKMADKVFEFTHVYGPEATQAIVIKCLRNELS